MPVRLTSLWLVIGSCGLTVVVVAATVLLWRAGGRWRPAVRFTGVVLIEALVVLSAGLIANRADDFYPSWQALTGDLAPVPKTVRQAAGRLDGKLGTSTAGLDWAPEGHDAWRLAAPPVLVAPPGYDKRTALAFPVVIAVTGADRVSPVRLAAAKVPDVLTLIVTPGPRTSAADLATLPERLAHDARVLAEGWAVVADPQYTALATQWHKSSPARIRTVTAIDADHPGAAVGAAARQLPEPLAAPVRLPS